MFSLRRLSPAYLTKSNTRNFTVLAIESSADDTCASVIHSSGQILSNIVLKQHDLHEGYGGIYPITAIQAHQRNMPFAVQHAIRDANVSLMSDINGIAVTRGPGMPGCLSVGMNAAKTLAAALGKPLVGVHHMQGHALTPLLTDKANAPRYPFLALLISGGHSLLLLVKSAESFRILATTLDESIGRSFDKVSRLLALKWTKLGPGDALEKFCTENLHAELPDISFPEPLLGRLEFSFSGLHSRVERYVHRLGGIQNINAPTKQALARAFQQAAVAHLEEKLVLALKWCDDSHIAIQNVVVSGGVASNLYLRERLIQCLHRQNSSISMNFPPLHLCTDNAAMIGWASMHRFLARDHDDYGIDLLPKWSIEEIPSLQT